MSGPALPDDRARKLIERLHALSEKQESALAWRLFSWGRRTRALALRRSPDFGSPAMRSFLRDRMVALDRAKCDLCYLLCRSSRALRAVELGTSYGVSTIYLASAIRQNALTMGMAGKVIGTELEPVKVAAARANLAEAGLSSHAEVREGDFRDTLRTIEGPVDFVLLDIWAPLARPALELLAPRLAPGATILCDNVSRYRREYRAYLEMVRDPAGGFRSLTLPFPGGVELSVLVGTGPAAEG